MVVCIIHNGIIRETLMFPFLLGIYIMNECDMVIEYYDLLFQRRTNYDSKSFPLAIQHKLDNMLLQHVLSDPNGMSEFISKVGPDTHKIVGFNKPWKWYTTFKDYPDIFEYIINNYYSSECSYVLSKKSHHGSNSSNIIFPFTNPYTNKFISIYDYNELQHVKSLAKFILKEKLNVDYRLITSIMYLLVLNGTPKLGVELCEYLNQREDIGNVDKDNSLQTRLYRLAREALKHDVYEALETWYLPDLLSRNTVFDMTPSENNMKSVRMFLDLIAQKQGYSVTSFSDTFNEKQFIQLYKKTRNSIDVSSMKLHPVYAFYLSRLYKLDLLEPSIAHNVKEEYKTIRTGILNNRLIVCKSDREFFDYINQMDVSEMEEFDRKLLNAHKLLIG